MSHFKWNCSHNNLGNSNQEFLPRRDVAALCIVFYLQIARLKSFFKSACQFNVFKGFWSNEGTHYIHSGIYFSPSFSSTAEINFWSLYLVFNTTCFSFAMYIFWRWQEKLKMVILGPVFNIFIFPDKFSFLNF